MFKSQVVGEFEQRLRTLGVPLRINFWDGTSVVPAIPPRVKLSVRTPRALAALLRPSMPTLAPGCTWVPRWRTRIEPALTSSPP